MKILFLVYHGFSEESGISKKILAQVNGLRHGGHEVSLCYYDFDSRGHRCRYVDGEVIADYGRGRLGALRSRLSMGCVVDCCRARGIEMVYVRHFLNASPFVISLFARLRRRGIRCVMEIPTFPYDAEVKGYGLGERLSLFLDRLFRRRLASMMDAIVTFSSAERIFGQRTLRISNGVDFGALPLRSIGKRPSGEIHLVGVAEIHYWHGFDRLVAGLGEYYRSMPAGERSGRKVFFHLVGVEDFRGLAAVGCPTIGEVAERYGIGDYVVRYGGLSGKELDAVFDRCDFAIGSLGRHRCGISDIKTLKNREYAARGIPFIYSENDADFEGRPYVMKAPADDSPIDVRAILRFIDSFDMSPMDIRRSVASLSWDCQMSRVVALTKEL